MASSVNEISHQLQESARMAGEARQCEEPNSATSNPDQPTSRSGFDFRFAALAISAQRTRAFDRQSNSIQSPGATSSEVKFPRVSVTGSQKSRAASACASGKLMPISWRNSAASAISARNCALKWTRRHHVAGSRKIAGIRSAAAFNMDGIRRLPLTTGRELVETERRHINRTVEPAPCLIYRARRG